jgi:hypothetical protein
VKTTENIATAPYCQSTGFYFCILTQGSTHFHSSFWQFLLEVLIVATISRVLWLAILYAVQKAVPDKPPDPYVEVFFSTFPVNYFATLFPIQTHSLPEPFLFLYYFDHFYWFNDEKMVEVVVTALESFMLMQGTNLGRSVDLVQCTSFCNT